MTFSPDYSDNSAWTWAAMEPAPTEREMQLFELFCQEYLIDRNATLAASRCGFMAEMAEEYGKRLFRKSYVQKRLKVLRSLDVTTTSNVEYDRALTVDVCRAVASDPSVKGSARIAAVRELSSIRGFHAPVKSQVDVNSRGGIVMLPGIASLDDWERAAQASQSALAEASRVT